MKKEVNGHEKEVAGDNTYLEIWRRWGARGIVFHVFRKKQLTAKKRKQGVNLILAEVGGELVKSEIQYLTLKYDLKILLVL